jgi:hypothetical protein
VIFFPLILFMCSVMFIDFYMLSHPCIPGVKPIWSWYVIFFLTSCWIQFASILLRIFTSMLIKDIGCIFLYGCFNVCIETTQHWGYCLHKMSLEAFLPFLFYGIV